MTEFLHGSPDIDKYPQVNAHSVHFNLMVIVRFQEKMLYHPNTYRLSLKADSVCSVVRDRGVLLAGSGVKFP